jgi:hypothetical protein
VVFFNEYFSIPAVRGFWLVQCAFIAFLVLNLLLALSYRRGVTSVWLVVVDVAVNLMCLGVPIAASGGRASPAPAAAAAAERAVRAGLRRAG